MHIICLLLTFIALLVLPAEAQEARLQSGPVAQRTAPVSINHSSLPVMRDDRPAGRKLHGSELSEPRLIAFLRLGSRYQDVLSGNGAAGADFNPNIKSVSIPFSLSADAPYLANNAALQGTPTTAAPSVQRLGFYTAGDAPALVYNASSLPCSLNGGNGDNGSQVKSLDNKCWIASKPAKGMDVRQWGCLASSADNTACLQAAITASYKDTLLIIGGPYVTGPLSASDQIIIIGSGGNSGLYGYTCYAGLRQKNPNSDVLVLNSGGTVQSLCIDQMPGAKNSTGGFGLRSIAADAYRSTTYFIENTVYGSCNGISVTAATQVGQMLEPNIIANLSVPYPSNNCNAYLIGDLSVKSQTGNVKFIANSTLCIDHQSTGLLIKDSGGLYAQDNITGFNCNISMKLNPGANQFVNYSQIGMGPMADTSNTAGIVIDPADSTSVMFGNSFNGTWASNTLNGPNILVRNSGNSPSATGLYFRNMQMYFGANQSGIDLGGSWRGIAIQNNTMCSSNANSPATAIIVGGAVSDVQITGNKINSCENFTPGVLATGISITTSAADIGMVDGNSLGSGLYPITTPLNFAPTAPVNSLQFILGSNKGITGTIPPPVTVASSISLPINPEVYLSGSGTISNMIGPTWQGKTVTIRLQTASTVNFANNSSGPGAICNPKTMTQFQSITAIYSSGYFCWFLQGP